MAQKSRLIELVTSAARTGSGTADVVIGTRPYRSLTVELDVTAAATEVDDVLAVFVQRRLPSGDWDDLISFTQVLGNGGAKRFVADIMFDSQASAERAARDATLAAGSVVAVSLTDALRVRWVVTDPGGGAASFTFSVEAQLMA